MEKYGEICRRHAHEYAHRRCIHGAVPSSYYAHDPDDVFEALGLRPGQTILDAGCGKGDYSLRAARCVGKSGIVHAYDVTERAVTGLKEAADVAELVNIDARVVDITSALPLPDGSVDICFVFTVLHIFSPETCRNMLAEIRRVLKSAGECVVIECKKEDTMTGPPIHMRLSKAEVEAMAVEQGFVTLSGKDLGNNYLVRFGIRPVQD